MIFRVRNWEKFQQYKDRRPRWIKLHRELLDNPAYFALSDGAARMLITCWLIACDDDKISGNLPDENTIAWRARVEPSRCSELLKELVDAEFLVQNRTEVYGSVHREEKSREETEGDAPAPEEINIEDVQPRDPSVAPGVAALMDAFPQIDQLEAENIQMNSRGKFKVAAKREMTPEDWEAIVIDARCKSDRQMPAREVPRRVGWSVDDHIKNQRFEADRQRRQEERNPSAPRIPEFTPEPEIERTPEEEAKIRRQIEEFDKTIKSAVASMSLPTTPLPTPQPDTGEFAGTDEERELLERMRDQHAGRD